MLDDRNFAANHHAIAALQTPDAAARSHVDVVNFLRREFLGAPDIIDVVRIPAINEDVAGLEIRAPGRRWFCPRPPAGTMSQTARGFASFCTKSASEEAPIAFSCDQLLDRFRRHIEDDASWPAFKSRRTMLAPILPSPIIPSCTITSLLFVICSLLGAGFLKESTKVRYRLLFELAIAADQIVGRAVMSELGLVLRFPVPG